MKTWIFQGSPDKFDIEGYLNAGLQNITWKVTRYADRIQPGDLVYIWQASGKKKGPSGILASATVVSNVWEGKDDESAHPFWKEEGAESVKSNRVWLRVGKVANKKEFIKREWLKEDPVCKDLLIVKQRAGTNYPVEPHQATRIASMWAKAGMSWSRPELVAALKFYEETFGKPIEKLPGSPAENLALLCGRSIDEAYNKLCIFQTLDPREESADHDSVANGDRDVWKEFYRESSQTIDSLALRKEFQKLWHESWVKPTSREQHTELERRVEDALEEERNKLEQRVLSTRTTKPPRKATTISSVYDRSPDVIAFAKIRANFSCEIQDCKYPLFKKPDGKNYLEVHHIVTLAEGGLDTMDNVACLCPSHHREIHFGSKAGELRKELLELRKLS